MKIHFFSHRYLDRFVCSIFPAVILSHEKDINYEDMYTHETFVDHVEIYKLTIGWFWFGFYLELKRKTMED